ncbi:hypothetical protein AJ79_07584 [Helicocarpus griseus UAMH5409]|uniref:DUF7069 domain-containing protein n=1 Tax=Helicocarpus griseus UAMH5409 TaxID=1447875 RepID=A0A2B7WTK4_9EURO|nr:hypothetical protein AJ79_07584 [Helicocarpus griseus UAMH5409]
MQYRRGKRTGPNFSEKWENFEGFSKLPHLTPRARGPKLENFYIQTSSRSSTTWLKFLVTSHPYSMIRQGFQSVSQIHLEGDRENDQIRKEISLVIKDQVAKARCKAQVSHAMQRKLEQQLMHMEHRTYLWLYLAIDDIRITLQDSLQPNKESIQLIPRSVNESYREILHRVPANKVAEMKMILQIIVGARRPLTIDEMTMTLGIAKSPHLRSAAETAGEFLLGEWVPGRLNSKWSFKLTDTEDLMSRICVRYLLMDDLGDAPPPECNFEIQSLFAYAVEHWACHVREMSPFAESELAEDIDLLYDTSSSRYSRWFPSFRKAVFHADFNLELSASELAAFNGHTNKILRLIRQGDTDTGQNAWEGAALVWASEGGHSETVKLLLKHGAYVDAFRGLHDDTCIHVACPHGRFENILTLLHDKAKKNPSERGFETALTIYPRSFDFTNLKLKPRPERPKEFDRVDVGDTALIVASRRGHFEIVKILLEHGAKADQNDSFSRALVTASYTGDFEIVKILLDHGAKNGQNHFGRALIIASHRGYFEAVGVLLEHGTADVNAENGDYKTALRVASKKEIVKILLEHDAKY